MAYNTGNPLGSSDFRDLSDNAVNFDKYANGPDPAYPNRFGELKLSVEGMNQAFLSAQVGRQEQFETQLGSMGYTWIGDYGPGLLFESRNQYTVRDGVPYAVANSTSLPYTSTGNWALEVSKFKVISADDILRGDLSQNDGAGLVGFDASIPYAPSTLGAAVKGLVARQDNVVYVTDDHGAGSAKGDGFTDDYGAIKAAIDFAVLTGRRTVLLPHPKVSYAVSQMIELTLENNFSFLGIGFPTIKYIGAAAIKAVLSLKYAPSATPPAPGRYNYSVSNLNLQGTATVEYGLHSEAVSHINLTNIRAWDVTTAGFRFLSGVCGRAESLRSTSSGGIAGAPGVVPTNGLVIDQRTSGDQLYRFTFINTIMEEFRAGYGALVNAANGCLFLGGTLEHCKYGLYTGVDSNYNWFMGIDYEDNDLFDTQTNGIGNVHQNMNNVSTASSINNSVQVASGTVFRDGYVRAVNLQSVSRGTVFDGVRFSDNGGLGLTGNGTYQMRGCVKQDTAGVITLYMPDKVNILAVGSTSGYQQFALDVGGVGSTSASSAVRASNLAGTVLLNARNDGFVLLPSSYANTTASAANLVIGSDGAISRSTSAMKYKHKIRAIPTAMIDKFMSLSLRGFLYCQMGDESGRTHLGFSADAFLAAGLDELVTFGEDGEVEGLEYERISVLQQELLLNILDRLAKLEAVLK